MDWIKALKRACEKTSQASVARRLNLSAATISLVLKGTYKGDMDAIEARVRGALMNEQVECPILGMITRDKCLDHQVRPRRFATANPQFLKLYRACRSGCPHSRLRGDD